MAESPDVVTTIVHNSDKVMGTADYTAKGFRALSGLQAFNKYDWMTDTRGFNNAGNFRGMVVSARWSTAYNVISKTGEVIGTVATVASIASNAIDLAPEFESVYRSQDDPGIKSLRYAVLAGTVAQRTLAGIVTGGVHMIYMPLIAGFEGVAKVGGGNLSSAAGVCAEVVKNADALVQQSAIYVTDPERQKAVIQQVVNIFVN